MTRHRDSGFTLIEVLVAIAIVGFALLSLLPLLRVGLRSTRLAGDFTTAAFLGRQELDEIRARAQARDFIDDNLNATPEASDGNGVHDAGEAFETGFFFLAVNPAGLPLAPTVQPPAVTLQAGSRRDGDGLGYFDLTPTVKKGAITQFRVLDPFAVTPQTYTIRIVVDAAGAGVDFITGGSLPLVLDEDFVVIGRDLSGNQLMLEGRFNEPFPLISDPNGADLNIGFTLMENTSPAFDEGADALDNDADGATDEVDEQVNDRYFTGESIQIHLVMVESAWYARWASRYDYSEDREIPELGIGLDGILTDVNPGAPVDIVEDTGLDLVPNFFDRNFDGDHDPGEELGETGFRENTLDDPHGDDGQAVDNDADLAFDEDPVDGVDNDADGAIDEDPPEWDAATGHGTENDGIINALPEEEIQRITVTVVWREGGTDREATFSTYIANPYL